MTKHIKDLSSSLSDFARQLTSHQSLAVFLSLATIVAAPLATATARAQAQRRHVDSHILSAKEVARRYMPSVVLIVCDDAEGNAIQGSGFLIDQGLVVTNYHIIRGMVRGNVKLPELPGRLTSIPVSAVLDFNASEDLALLLIDARRTLETTDDPGGVLPEVAEMRGVSKAALRDSGIKASSTESTSDDPLGIGPYLESGAIPQLPPANEQVTLGEKIFVLGNPEGLEGTISEGIVSGIRQLRSSQLLQITAPVSSGSSGGPVINTKGQVIGVVTSSLAEGQNLNFAVPAQSLRTLSRDRSGSYRWGSSATGAWKISNRLPTP